MPTYVAVDLGATSGRIVNVRVHADSIDLDVVHRFPTSTLATPDGGLTWNFTGLLDDVRRGLKEAVARGPVTSVAVDSWGLDYGLLDRDGRRRGPVHSYRSSRTTGIMESVSARVGRATIYDSTGTQFLPFNTSFQLVAASDTDDYAAAQTLLMVADLVNHALCGSTTNDVTNASTTQLLDVSTRRWSDGVIADLGLRRDLMPELHEPGTPLGIVRETGHRLAGLPVVSVASHDTASAVAGTPLRPDRPAIYISCGTWSLVGCELTSPVTDPVALAANVTNELGVDGTVRLLKNVTGLWLLEECRRTWHARGTPTDPVELASAAAQVPGGTSVIDPDDPRFLTPGDMPRRIAEACEATGQPVPSAPAEVTRVIFDSLALTWRATIATIEQVAGFDAEIVHLVGGGSAIGLLARLCASASGRPVLAGPAEATVVGNALVQAIAAGAIDDVVEGRAMVERTMIPDRVDPADTLAWDDLSHRLDR